MKRINVNKGHKIFSGNWDEAFCMARGNYFGLRGPLPDDEADAAIEACEQGASPMQACMYLYGKRGRFARMVQGTNPDLILPGDDAWQPPTPMKH
jgi:hypothetical protein